MSKISPDISRILLAPEEWALTTPGAEPDGRVSPDAKRRAWSERHAHVKPHREIMLAMSGTGWFGMGGVLYPCRPGTLFLIEPNVSHDNFYPPDAPDLEHIWITVFYEKNIFINWRRIRDGHSRRLHKPLSILPKERIGIPLELFPDVYNPVSSTRDITRLRLLVGLVTTYLDAQLESNETPTEKNRATPKKDVVRAVRSHIDETAGKGITLDSLAHYSGYSKYYLHRIFREQTGCTIQHYKEMARRRRMQDLLRAGVTGTSISEALGFANPSAFSRWRRRSS